MACTIRKLTDKGLISPPAWMPDNIHYECVMGSIAYGVSNDSSDWDIYGFCVPEKKTIFPHLAGEIMGFGRQKKRFEQYEQQHVFSKDDLGGRGREYDFTIFNIVKYFQLCMGCNPNMIDSLFVPRECVLHTTQVGEMVREQRYIFLHKGIFHRMKGYAFKQMGRLDKAKEDEDVKNIRDFEDDHEIPHAVKFVEALEERYQASTELDADTLREYKDLYETGMSKSKRFENRKIFDMDTKFAYNIVRLCDECEQVLEHGDLNLQRAKEHMKAVRKGEVSEKELRSWFAVKEKELEKLYTKSTLPHKPDEEKIKKLLLECLEHCYGNLSDAIVTQDAATQAIDEMKEILFRYDVKCSKQQESCTTTEQGR